MYTFDQLFTTYFALSKQALRKSSNVGEYIFAGWEIVVFTS
jgi:hypothetical protein